MGVVQVGRTLRDAFGAVLRNPAAFAAAQGPWLAIGAILAVAISAAVGGTVAAVGGVPSPPLLFSLTAAAVTAFVGYLACAALALGMGVLVAREARNGRRTPFGHAWRALRPNAWTLVGTVGSMVAVAALLVWLPFSIGLANLVADARLELRSLATWDGLLAILGAAGSGVALWMTLRWSVAPALAVFGGCTVRGALARSSTLTRGSRLAILAALGLVVAMYMGVAAALAIPVAFLVQAGLPIGAAVVAAFEAALAFVAHLLLYSLVSASLFSILAQAESGPAVAAHVLALSPPAPAGAGEARR